MTVVNYEEMKKALEYKFDRRMPKDEINGLTNYIMNFFGFNDEVLDNILNEEDRSIFYMLEDEGLLTATSVLHNDIFLKRPPTPKEPFMRDKDLKWKSWTEYKFRLNKVNIRIYSNNCVEENEKEDYSCYGSEEIWVSIPQKLVEQEQ